MASTGPWCSAVGRGSGRLRARFAPGGRIRGHPYVRLALDARFAAFWLAQTISLFGDRLHQVALGVLALASLNSPLATGLVFLAATLPNMLLGPIAGTFVDRWDHKRVMIVVDLIRAALVVAIPFAAAANFVLVYPLVFLVTTVSLFFRPAKTAVVPRIVDEDDVMAANSATWTADTLADIVGFPLAGLFVAFLGTQRATWPGLLRRLRDLPPERRAARLDRRRAGRADRRARGGRRVCAFRRRLSEGWRFLRTRPALFQNTLVSTFAQMSLGVTLALTVVYAKNVLDRTVIPYPKNYAAIDTAIGLGNLVGGLAVG